MSSRKIHDIVLEGTSTKEAQMEELTVSLKTAGKLMK